MFRSPETERVEDIMSVCSCHAWHLSLHSSEEAEDKIPDRIIITNTLNIFTVGPSHGSNLYSLKLNQKSKISSHA